MVWGSTNLARMALAISLAASLACGTQPAAESIAVAVTPATAQLAEGATQAFTAQVTGSANTSVAWSVAPGTGGGTVDASGLYTAPMSAGTFQVIATSAADSSKTATATVTVNAAAPSQIVYSASSLDCTVGIPCSLVAPSHEGGAVSSWSITPSLPAGLQLDPASGAISGTPSAPAAAISYAVTATNSGGEASAMLTIAVGDAAPSQLAYASSQLTCTVGVACSLAAPTSVGGAPTAFAIAPSLPAGLSLNPGTGAISGTPTALAASAVYTVTASNPAGSISEALTIVVNDVAPSAISYASTSLICTSGVACSLAAPTSAGGAILSFAVTPALPAGLSLNAITGAIAGTPTAISASASYSITGDNSGGSASATISITVDDVSPSGLTYAASALVCSKNIACSLAAPTSTGGAVIAFSVSPALPGGLALDARTGAIAGTPGAASPLANFIVTAVNSGGSASAGITITVKDTAPSGLAYGSSTLVCTKNVACSLAAPANSGGAVTSFSVSPALPAGLSLNTATGAISGTPTAISPSASYSITAANSGGSTNASLSITVNDAAPSGITYASASLVCTKGVACSFAAPGNSGGAAVSFSISPSLPSGLSFNTSTGAISGTPTSLSALANYVVTAANSGGSASASISVAVNDVAPSALTYSTSSLTCTKSVSCSLAAPASTGGAVLSFSVSPALPAGLSLNTSTGAISGTPTALATAANYVVTASNSGGLASATLSITVAAGVVAPSGLAYSTSSLVCTKGAACTLGAPGNAGSPASSYSISPALPAGLVFNTVTGAISGTPSTIAAAASYTVTATNSAGSTTASLFVTVNDAPPSGISYASSSLVCTKNLACSLAAPTSSGGAVTSFSVSPALPAGLVLNASTGAISGTPAAVSALTNYVVTANNSGGSSSATVSVTVKDTAPSGITYASNALVCSKNVACSLAAPTSSGGAVTSFSVSPALPAGLVLNVNTGAISGTPTEVSALANYVVTALNSGGSASANLSVTVNDTAPSGLSYSPSALVCTKNTACSLAAPTNSGGAAISFSISPALPAGLALSTSTGAISGTPTVLAAAANYVVTVTNSGGSTSGNVSVTVNDTAPSGLAYSPSSLVCSKNVACSLAAPTNSGGAATSFSISPALPAGLALSTSTGAISGTPTVVSALANYVVTASNSGGSTSASVSVTVKDTAPSGLTYSPGALVCTKNIACSLAAPTNSGGAVISFAISPSLPAGLALSTSTGAISGAPTALSTAANYVVTATNSGGSTSGSVSVTVNDAAPSALSYSPSSLVCTKGAACALAAPTNSGGAAISFSITPALPAGLALSTSTGAISGTPTVLATAANYVVTAINSGGSTSATVNVTVNDVAPSALVYSPNTLTCNVDIACSLAAPTSGGGPVLSYAISPALPAGLVLSTSTGAIAGIPSAATAAAVYTVTASNSGGTATATLTITVNSTLWDEFAWDDAAWQ